MSGPTFWSAFPDVLFAVLIGSRVEGGAHEHSDWDIAVLWRSGEALERVGKHEVLRRALARLLDLEEARVDLIDLANSGLAMRAAVAEDGRLLYANDELAWAKYLIRTWRELEDYYWEQSHAA
ncbi:MAG: type VII toxin-antitoxin system MntA family adenylyltransferase antitoxin [Pseudomonadota bacterium]